ncbi:MAG: cyclic nucleotide-binding domain-containing protein [Flavobacteriaceae bacterium]|jgi:CRP-like cAMP-binding protein|nr:cyclic nucleotide-binding domain-containing protein [Flavobacteriaceae bacterium]
MESIIAYFESLSTLSEQSKELLSDLIEEEYYGKGDIIQEIGSSCKTIYFITDGVARIFYFKDGQDITEHFAFDSHIIIRAESLFREEATAKGIQALTALKLIKINAAALFALFDLQSDIERLFYKIITNEYLSLTKRVEELQIYTATERYYELLKQTTLVNEIPLKYIATYLGITHVSLSRIRAGIK